MAESDNTLERLIQKLNLDSNKLNSNVLNSSDNLQTILSKIKERIDQDNCDQQSIDILVEFVHSSDASFIFPKKSELAVDIVEKYCSIFQRILKKSVHTLSHNEEDVPLERSEFTVISVFLEKFLTLLTDYFGMLLTVERETKQLYKEPLMKSLAPSVFALSASCCTPNLWSNETMHKSAIRLMDQVVDLCDANDTIELLSGTEDTLFPDGLIATVLKQLQPNLNKECWKQNPMALHCYRWCLFEMCHPHLGEFMDHVLPPALLLIDDYLPKNKISGIECIQHIVKNVAPTQLLWHGRADVLYSALESQLYSNDQKLLENVHSCILSITEILDRSKMEKTLGVTRYDSILKIILTNMEIEDKIKLRRFYSGILIQYIEQMQLSIVRFLRRLLLIVANYLEMYDGPEETSRINILKVLNLIIKYAWPRIPYHSDDILKWLLKFMYDISTDESLTTVAVKQQLVDMAQDVLVLLNYATSGNTVKLLEGIQDVHETEMFRKAIVNVCTSTNKE